MFSRLNIASYTLTCSAGAGLVPINKTISTGKSPLVTLDKGIANLDTCVGLVHEAQRHTLPKSFCSFDGRNNRLMDFALAQDEFERSVSAAIKQFGATRIGVIVGSSTASMSESEKMWHCSSEQQCDDIEGRRNQDTQIHAPHSPGCFLAHRLGLVGPSITISTACSSSAKAFAMAQRWLDVGLVDAVVMGGADSLSLGTLYGFSSLNLLSGSPCKPFDANRDGISVGEAAGFVLLTRTDNRLSRFDTGSELLGYGETSDAHHMSHPHPEAQGAIAAMREAMACSQCHESEIGYLNLHGTATPTNDLIEDKAVSSLFDVGQLIASSTKGFTGHTLGAAGITSAVIALEALRAGITPGTVNLQTRDTSISLMISANNRKLNTNKAMVNTFGFGGSNCSLLFGRRST